METENYKGSGKTFLEKFSTVLLTECQLSAIGERTACCLDRQLSLLPFIRVREHKRLYVCIYHTF